MARQSTTPVQFPPSRRPDEGALMSSGEAGEVTPVGFIPLLRGDAMSGGFAIDINLAHMPRPLLNGVMANVQAWFVPKSAHPQFNGHDEFMASYNGTQLEALGAEPRDPPALLRQETRPAEELENDKLLRTLGIHPVVNASDENGNVTYTDDLHDAFMLINNFRRAAHSAKLPLNQYHRENKWNLHTLPPAFWPTGNRSQIVPDYERALVVGELDFDVIAGQIPVSGIERFGGAAPWGYANSATDSAGVTVGSRDTANSGVQFNLPAEGVSEIFGEMEGQSVAMTLADLDKARETQAFAKLRAAMAGNDSTGYNDDTAILADLMSGLRVPESEFKRPWLLDQVRVPFGFQERMATDGANLDASTTTGRASATLSLNVPQQDTGGVVIITLEVIPERIDERMSEEWLLIGSVDDYPNALRDIQRTEPVDFVENRRIDARHTTPEGLYGFEPMNAKWSRNYTRLGGSYYQADPANPWTEQRSAIWMANVVDPDFTEDHYLVPQPFPKYVFSDTTAPAFEFVARHQCVISGLTQIGDVLHENSDDYPAITGDDDA